MLKACLVGGFGKKNKVLIGQLRRVGIDVISVMAKDGSSTSVPKSAEAVLYLTWCATNRLRDAALQDAERMGIPFVRLRRPLWNSLQEMADNGWIPPLPPDLHPRDSGFDDDTEEPTDPQEPSMDPKRTPGVVVRRDAPRDVPAPTANEDAVVMDRASALLLARATAADKAAERKREEAKRVRDQADLLDLEADELVEKAKRLRVTAAEFEAMLTEGGG